MSQRVDLMVLYSDVDWFGLTFDYLTAFQDAPGSAERAELA